MTLLYVTDNLLSLPDYSRRIACSIIWSLDKNIIYIHCCFLLIHLKVAVSVYNNGVKFLTSNNTQSARLHYEHVLGCIMNMC